MQHAINLHPEADSLAAQDLHALVRLWLDRQALRLPASTLRTYRARINVFLAWWADHGPPDWLLTEKTLIDFAAWLPSAPTRDGKPYSWHSQNDILRRLRQALRWAYQPSHRMIPFDASAWVPSPPGGPPLRLRAGLEDLRRLMQGAGQSRSPLRDRAYIALLIGTGLRRAEAVALDVDDVQMDAGSSGTIAVRQAKRVKGRDVQGRVIAFDAWTGEYLRALLDERPLHGPLFVGHGRAERMSLMAANRLVKRAVARAGLQGRIQGPHDLRRAFATYTAAQHQGDVLAARLLSRQMGHANFRQTDGYIWHDAEDLRGFVRSPLAEEGV